MEKKNTAGILRAVLCLLAIFIPTYIAIAAIASGPREAYAEKKHEITALTLTDTRSASFEAKKDADENGLIEVFTGIFQNAAKVSALSDSVRATPAMNVSVRRADESADAAYRFYFNPKATSYYEDGAGQAFGIQDDDAAKFFRTPAAACLFGAADVPCLKTAYDKVILPAQMSWYYRDPDGTYRPSAVELSESAVSVELDGAFTLSFDIAPDFVKATVRRGDSVVYDGALNQLAAGISVTESVKYDMTVTAEWYEDPTRDYKGSATYRIAADVYAPADFSLGETSVEAGQIAVINGKNIRDVSIISVTTEPALRWNGETIKPVFCGEGETWSALLPIPATCFADNAKTGKTMTYAITVSYGAQNYTFNLDVTDRSAAAPKTGNTAKDTVNAARTSELLASVASLYRDTAAKSASAPLFGSDKFYRYYEDGKYNFSLAFGKRWKLSTGDTYMNEGVDFVMKAGSSVVATASGKVAAVGENALIGKYVCIDHGMGLQSWYLHLGSISAAEGDTVARAQEIAKSGSTGFLPNSDVGFSLVYTVYGVPVCSYAQTSKKGLEETGLNILAFHE